MVKYTQTIRLQQLPNCLSVFDHFVALALKGLYLLKQTFHFRPLLQTYFDVAPEHSIPDKEFHKNVHFSLSLTQVNLLLLACPIHMNAKVSFQPTGVLPSGSKVALT